MKNDREMMQALLDDETLVNKDGLTWNISHDGFMLWPIGCGKYPDYSNVKIKPRTININGFEVPEPLRKYPEVGTVIFLASTNCKRGNNYSKWRNEETYFEWIEKGIVHLTQESAQKHIDALLSFTRTDK
jgi:hypothetical protein